jgi:hypothetical protein
LQFRDALNIAPRCFGGPHCGVDPPATFAREPLIGLAKCCGDGEEMLLASKVELSERIGQKMGSFFHGRDAIDRWRITADGSQLVLFLARDDVLKEPEHGNTE